MTTAPITIMRPVPAPESTDTDRVLMELEALTPEQKLEAFEEASKSKIPQATRDAFMRAQLYQAGDLEDLHDAGAITMWAQGPRLFGRAIMKEEGTILGLAGEVAGHAIERNAKACIAHEIIGVGDGVDKHLDKLGVPDDTRDKRSLRQRLRAFFSGRGARYGARPRVGDHIHAPSTCSDRASKTDMDCRLWAVHVDDVTWRWTV